MIDRSLLKQVIKEQQAIQLPADYIERTIAPRVESLVNSDLVLIITGIRRCGKSMLLRALRLKRCEDYYINFDDDRLLNFTLEDFQVLYEVFVELYGTQTTFYFDEIQNIEGWERFVRRLQEQGSKVFITGSNATMLSMELGTRLTGRHVTITLYPFSFAEFIHFCNKKMHDSLDNTNSFTTQQTGQLLALFQEYMQIGGMPGYVRERLPEYLQSIFENIIYRDIIVRYKLTKQHQIRQLAFFIASNVGKRITYNSVRKMLLLGSHVTAADYYQYMENSFLSFIINTYSPSLKTQFATEKKQYFIDQGMARVVGFRTSADDGPLLENMVFMELKRRGYDIYVNGGPPECDFLLHKNNHVTAAIQVCKSLAEPETREREYAGVLNAMQQFNLHEGLILTEDLQETNEIKVGTKNFTVHIKPIWRWLLE